MDNENKGVINLRPDPVSDAVFATIVGVSLLAVAVIPFEDELFPQFEGGDELCINTGVRWDKAKLKDKTVELGYDLRKKLNLKIADMGEEGSAFFKEVYINPSRLGAQVREDQVEDTLE